MATRVNGFANEHGPIPAGNPPPHEREPTVPTLPEDDEDPRPDPVGQIIHGGIGRPSDFTVLSSRPANAATSSSVSASASEFTAYEKQYYPGQPISLSGIASRAFLLGIALALSTSLTIYLLLRESLLWRLSFFVAALATFHFLEFWTTARYNTKTAQVSSFLLSQNGSAYTLAHTAAMIECFLSCIAYTYAPFPNRLSLWLFPHWTSSPIPSWVGPLAITTGLVLIVVGQLVRSIAMVQAGESFNHIVQARKSNSHRLVTSGIYTIFRHPSYWGFFWWGLGTQLVLGNIVCFAGYAAVLWLFFKRRIAGE